MTKQLPIETVRPTIRVLSEEGVRAIHNTTLQIMSEVGFEMKDPQGRELLLAGGAWESEGRIHIPERMVDEAIDKAPSRIPMYNRLGDLTMPLELGKVFFGSGSDTTFTLDVETGERRRTVAADAEMFARLGDALKNFDFVMSMANPADVPPDDLHLHSFIRMMRGSVKPIVFTAKDREDLEQIQSIAAAVVGGEEALREKPFLLQYAEPISPLLIPEDSLQKVISCAERGLPVAFAPSPNTGGGGPITLAGAVSVGNAETLLGLIITQLIRPGTPYLYGMNTAAMDMKTAIVCYGSPEWSLGMGAWTDMARYYNLPAWGYGGATDSKVVDAQTGIEATFSIMSAYLTRCTLIHDVGYMEYGSCSSAELMVICDEIIDMTRFFMEGLSINDDTLALETIAQVRPGGGFLAEDHTLSNWRWAQWAPEILDRKRYDAWVGEGSKDLFARANARAREILEEHEVAPLPEGAEAAIEEVLSARGESR